MCRCFSVIIIIIFSSTPVCQIDFPEAFVDSLTINHSNQKKPTISYLNLFSGEEESAIKGVVPDIPKQVLDITYYRLQSGNMIDTIYQVLTKAEITIDMSIEDEHLPERLPSALLYRNVRQSVYGILFDLAAKKKDDKFDVNSLAVKEWCVYGGRRLNDPDLVEPVALDWDVPPVDKLWFSKGAIADSNRLKAFLSCMMSNTPSMTQTVIVPKRLVILCCILR